MTLKVTIKPEGHDIGNYPVYYTLNGALGVKVGHAGDLTLVASRDHFGEPTEFRVYAPGSWKEINVEETDD